MIPHSINCLFAAVTLIKNTNIDKYGYSGYGIDFEIDMVLNAEHRLDFGKIKVGLIKWILIVGFSGILGIVR